MATRGHPPPHVAPPLTRRRRRELFRADIEGLRAVAVLLVVAYHADIGLVGGGFVGVDVFLVLSGFLITGLLLDEAARTGTISLTAFYARRMRRLLPLSATVLAATALAVLVLVPPVDRSGIAADLVASALWVANWRFAAESTQYLADPSTSPVLHYWSLAVEEQFYLVWPLVLLLLVGRSGLARRAWSVVVRRVGLVLGVVVVGSLVWSWLATSAGSAFAYFGLHTRAWELGIGALLALGRPALRVMTRRAASLAGVLGLVLVVGSAVLMDASTPFPGLAALAPVLGTALVVAGGTRLRDGRLTEVLSNIWLGYVGRISYGWYLWHWPVLVLSTQRWGNGAGVVTAAVLGSFVLAALSHHLVEQPARQARVLSTLPWRSFALGGGLVTSSVLAGVLLVGLTPDGGSAVVSAPPASTGAEPAATPSQEAVLAGEVARTVDPATLREPNTPEEARGSRQRENKCYVGYEAGVAPPAERCRVGPADGERRIALIGDSHANALYPAFAEMAERLGWTVYHYGKSGCSVIDARIDRVGEPVRYEACERWREDVLRRLAEVGPLDAVVIGRWRSYEGSVLLSDGSTSTAATVGPAWTAASVRTFDRLKGLTDHVVVVREIPWASADVPSCLSRNPDDVVRCAFTRPDPDAVDGPLAAAERAAARGRPVGFVDLTDAVCPRPTCQVVTPEGQIKYADNHHLTAGYSATLWPEVSRRLEAAVGGRW